MNFNSFDFIDFDKEQYDKVFSSNVWEFNFTKNNYPETVKVKRELFKDANKYFNIYKNDHREPINVYEYHLYLTLKGNNPNTIFHSVANYLCLSRFIHCQDIYKYISNLEMRGYIKVDRNYEKGDIFRSYNSKKQFLIKIYAIDFTGKELTISYSEKIRRKKSESKKIKKKNNKNIKDKK